jgi:hypothetical protein
LPRAQLPAGTYRSSVHLVSKVPQTGTNLYKTGRTQRACDSLAWILPPPPFFSFNIETWINPEEEQRRNLTIGTATIVQDGESRKKKKTSTTAALADCRLGEERIQRSSRFQSCGCRGRSETPEVMLPDLGRNPGWQIVTVGSRSSTYRQRPCTPNPGVV